MPDLAFAVEAALGRTLGRPVRMRKRTALGGGDISQVERIDTDAGGFVLKWHPRPPDGLFRAEAAGLAALRTSGTSLRIPDVLAVGEAPAFLVLEDLGRGTPGRDFDETFARGLAEVHKHTSSRFGFDADNFCGATPQPNDWSNGWVEFYGRARLGHQTDLAARAGHLTASDQRRLEQLTERLATWIDEPREGASLIHGDLWAGNLHVAADGTPALVDPAAYFAHREAELGMMTLFGRLTPRMLAAYEEALPLEPGWRERNPLYQLYHLLNHLNLFGGGYHSQVMAITRQFV